MLLRQHSKYFILEINRQLSGCCPPSGPHFTHRFKFCFKTYNSLIISIEEEFSLTFDIYIFQNIAIKVR